jgi:tRNA pseudouridine38-40 synthase
VIGSGRTDSGVHAVGQVIAFDVEWWHEDSELLRAINAVLPDAIALQDLMQQPGFHPRFDALSRCYAYTVINAAQRQPLWNGQAWHVWGKLDVEALNGTAALVVGEHDFGTFGSPPQGTSTIRQMLHSCWQVYPEPFGQRLVYEVEGNAFLYHMVRRMVGMQMDVARGLVTLQTFEAAFRAADLSLAGTIAPPQGLVFKTVRYAG